MTSPESSPEPVDPVDVAAADIDARSPDVAEQIEEVVETAQDVGRDADADDPADTADRGGG